MLKKILQQVAHESAGNTAERGVRADMGMGCAGRRADQAPTLPNLSISITYSSKAGKAVIKTTCYNELTKDKYKTSVL